ncbi:MAG TPA: biotin/lipoyl-containing protein [Streptosporangiaceae bacterium]|nr:biotin/lipoyl-containing protein [Streptosporangiaceae bacterium]
MNLTDDDVRDILRLLDSLPYAELRLETDSFRLWLRRTGDGEWTRATQVLSPPAEVGPAAAAEPAAAPAPPAAADTADRAGPAREGLLEVRAPLLGTFYRAPRPGAEPFVEVGSAVVEDTVVGIIETMKLMNSVPAGVRGTVVEICVANVEFAERDAVLMLVVPE